MNYYNKSFIKPKYKSESRVFSKDILKYTGGNEVNKMDINNYKLNNRIKNYWKLRKILLILNENDCLEKKVFNNNKGFTIRNIINLEKKIGTDSNYGAIYLTSIPNFHITYPIATKIMKYDQDNILEINIMVFIVKNILLKNFSRHFLMIYGYSICNKSINEKQRLISINEIADGDLNVLFNNIINLNDNELILNILFQTFISIATFHILVGYIHNDTHNGNFLYQENNEIGYYHYIFDGKDYYLKSCKYNIIIYDYGFATKINTIDNNRKDKKHIYSDYKKICHAFINEINGGWIKSLNLPDNYINTIIKNVKQILINNIYLELNDKKNYNKDKLYSFTLFTDIIENIFLKYSPPGMFITIRPLNIINDIPFIIG
jgi:hypothetical protein